MRGGRFDYSCYPQIAGELFRMVQERGPYTDAKTFVDAEATVPGELVSERFRAMHDRPRFDLGEFLDEHFDVPDHVATAPELPPDRTMEEHVETLWEPLTRRFDVDADSGGTLLSLPAAHVVPGGRFREMYYWDSYFIGEGLAAAGHVDRVADMVENVASLIERFGFVPLGNRVYYDSRSQFPVFVFLLRILERERGSAAVEPYLEHLETEYEFWMAGSDHIAAAEGSRAHRRAVSLDAGTTLNRYWDDRARPRPEAYGHDRALAGTIPTDDRPRFFRDLRAAAESGWDFSSRWFVAEEGLPSIHTTDLLPVDLNAALYAIERALAEWLPRIGREEAAMQYATAAEARREAIRERFWHEDREFFVDYDWRAGSRVDRRTLAGVAPLFAGAATDWQAARVAEELRTSFLEDGGLVTTLVESGQQWDAPNGWAPLQWMAVVGLYRYGHDDLAREVSERWLELNRRVFDATGRMAEKYDVTAASTAPDAGEYPLQYGFGWTNGVAVALQRLPDESVHPPSP